MQDDEKKTIFRKGAAEAAKFFREFDWEKYKNERAKSKEIYAEQGIDLNNFKGIK